MDALKYELLQKIKCYKRYTMGKFPGKLCEICSYKDLCQGINVIYLKGFQDGSQSSIDRLKIGGRLNGIRKL